MSLSRELNYVPPFGLFNTRALINSNLLLERERERERERDSRRFRLRITKFAYIRAPSYKKIPFKNIVVYINSKNSFNLKILFV